MPRTEHDFLGDRELPNNAYYRVQTLRATENFPISGVLLNRFPDPGGVANPRSKVAAPTPQRRAAVEDRRPAARGLC
jgi:aspartate ammonia-lyase